MKTLTSLDGKRTYLDPIHGDIVLNRHNREEDLVMRLIDTQEFQRLRRIHQLGVSFFTYQGAEGSRFTHSVGVMHLAYRLFELLKEKTPSIEKYRAIILASALLHDVGHGPYSHVTEKILHYNHENWSVKIILGDTEVNKVLSQYDKALPEQVAGVLQKNFMPHYLSDIVSSQLDCDRFDYLLRDSYMTGTAYGLFALDRILSSLEIDEVNDRILVSSDKGQTAVEHYLFARYSMYASVYFHKKNLASRALLSKLVRRARFLGDNIGFIDEPTRKWLMDEELSVDEYIQLDDVQMSYHIKRWAKDKDVILSDLASRILNRRLFKAAKLDNMSDEQITQLLNKAKATVAKLGLDPDYYIGYEPSDIKPYELYQPSPDSDTQSNIMIRATNGKVSELSEMSTMVQALTAGDFKTSWIIYPAEIKNELQLLL
jgi:HD superfamily phosphohydrolase